MTKASVAPLQAHYDGASQTTAFCWRVAPLIGSTVYGFTSHDQPLEFGGLTYYPTSAFDASAMVTRADMNVDTVEARGLQNAAGIEGEAIEAGDWDGAEVVLYRVNWAAPASGAEIMRTGTVGTIRAEGQGDIAEIRSLMQALQVNLGHVLSPLCRYDLGDTRCGVDLPAITVSGTVTGVTSRRVFTASALAGAVDYYAWGEVLWTAGANTGKRQDVRSNATGGVVTLSLPMGRDVQIGDTFSITPGCDKRHELVRDAAGAVTSVLGDCKNKFNNVLRNGGYYAVAGEDAAGKINGQ